ncbi:MAG: prepilin peptidase [Myxococcota bacterium]
MSTSDLTPFAVRLLAFLFGSLWGSFFNVAIHRLPFEESVVFPSSRCPSCGVQIPPWQNIPIVSWCVLRGRAACCSARISPRYVFVEVLAGLLCLAVAEVFFVRAPQFTPASDGLLQTGLWFSFAGALLIATFTDLEHMIIPDEISLPGCALGLVTATVRHMPGAEAAAMGAGIGFLIIQVPFVWAYELATGRRGMGEGDAKLLMMIGAFLGWEGVLFTLAIGSMQGVVATALLGAAGKLGVLQGEPESAETTSVMPESGAREDPEDPPTEAEGSSAGNDCGSEEALEESRPAEFGRLKIKFGPFLSLAALEYLFFGTPLVDWYFGLLTF